MQPFRRHGRQKPKIGYMFFGGCGSNFALQLINTLNPDDYPELSLFVANTDADHLEDFFGDKSNTQLMKWFESRRLKVVQIGAEVTDGDGAGANPEIGLLAARTEESMRAIRAFQEENSIIILFAGAGKGTGGPTLQVAAEIAVNLREGIEPQKHKITIAIVVMPRGDEGLSDNADKARDAITDLVPTITIYNSKIDSYLEGLSEAERMAFGTFDSNAIVDEMAIRPTLQTSYEITQRTGEVHLDRADMRGRLSEGTYLYSGEIRFSKEKAATIKAKTIVDGIFSPTRHFQEVIIAQRAENVMLWFVGWEPLIEQGEVIKQVHEFVTKDNPNKKKQVTILKSVRRRIPDSEDRRVIVLVVAKKQSFANIAEPETVGEPISAAPIKKLLTEVPAQAAATTIEGEKSRPAAPAAATKAVEVPQQGTSNLITFPVGGVMQKPLSVSYALLLRFNRDYNSETAERDLEKVNKLLDDIQEVNNGVRPDSPLVRSSKRAGMWGMFENLIPQWPLNKQTGGTQ